MQLQLYKNKITLKIYDVHIWQLVKYLTNCNVILVSQMKHLIIYFGMNVNIEQVFTLSSSSDINSPPIKNILFSPMYIDLPNL